MFGDAHKPLLFKAAGAASRNHCEVLWLVGRHDHARCYSRVCRLSDRYGRKVRGSATIHNADIRWRLTVLHPVRASRKNARPKPPRDGGPLPETRSSRILRPYARAMPLRRVGADAGWRPPPGRRRRERGAGRGARYPAPDRALRVTDCRGVARCCLQLGSGESPPTTGRRTLLHPISGRVPMRA